VLLATVFEDGAKVGEMVVVAVFVDLKSGKATKITIKMRFFMIIDNI